MSEKNLPTWEVFIQSKTGVPFQHTGNLHATDKEMALQNARDLYTRRHEGTCIWVVKAEHIVSSTSNDSASFFDPSDDKVYRYPTFFKVSKNTNSGTDLVDAFTELYMGIGVKKYHVIDALKTSELEEKKFDDYE